MSSLQKIAKTRLISPFINQPTNNIRNGLRQYNEYLYSQNRIEVITRCLKPQKQNKLNQISNHNTQYGNITSNTEIDDILSDLERKKENISKNILFSFKKHILTCKDIEIIKLYESMTDDQWTYISIKKKVKQNFRSLRRLSQKLKNLITCKNLQKIFLSYLQNSEKLWLSNSKIQNKESYKESIGMILKVCQSNLLNNNYLYYNNSKQQF